MTATTTTHRARWIRRADGHTVVSCPSCGWQRAIWTASRAEAALVGAAHRVAAEEAEAEELAAARAERWACGNY
jgi:Zn-finger protein